MNFTILESNEHLICATIDHEFLNEEIKHFIFAFKRKESVDIHLGISLTEEKNNDLNVLIYRFYYPDKIDFNKPMDFIGMFLSDHEDTVYTGFKYITHNFCV